MTSSLPATPTKPRRLLRLRGWAASRRRLLAGLIAVAVLLIVVGLDDVTYGDGPGDALRRALAPEGLEVDASSVTLVGDPGPGGAPVDAVFRARRVGEAAHDVWVARVRWQSERGRLLDVSALANLSRTSGADESRPAATGLHVAYLSATARGVEALTCIDLSGEPDALTADWSLVPRVQNAITNRQETGRWGGVGRIRYRFKHPAPSAELSIDENGRFVVELHAGAPLRIDPARPGPLEGADQVLVETTAKAMPGGLPWIVDTVRAIEWVGPEPIEWLENRVYRVKDAIDRAWHALFGSSQQTAAAVAEETGLDRAERDRRRALAVAAPELDWPPPAMTPLLAAPLEGEGEWTPLAGDPFVRTYPGAPPPFCQSFIRPDPERDWVRVHLVAFHPALVQLHLVSGTREPLSATGETGTGRVPRDPEVLHRLVGAFNGGFQALHGEFGMMADRRVYLPPKPWAATVAVHDDGRVSMGSWPGPPPGVRVYEERWAVQQIPPDVVAYRQNLTSLVEDGVYNPWERWYWGAAPVDATEQSLIDRTGLCLTDHGHLVYFYGASLGPDHLGRAMLAARCKRGMQLDINARHTGMELYDVRGPGETHPPLGRPLGEGEYEGPVPDAPAGTVARVRLVSRAMTPLRFPRYFGRDARDFFYLTLRPVLPGPPLADGTTPSSDDLPHAGYPFAFARASWGPADRRTHLIRIDPTRAVPAPLGADTSAPLLGWLSRSDTSGPSGAAAATYSLHARRALVGWRFAVGATPPDAVVLLSGPPLREAPQAVAAIGVDPDGFLVYLERHADDVTPLSERASLAGVREAVALVRGERLRLTSPEGAFDVGGLEVAEAPGEHALRLYARTRPYAEVLAPDNRPMPYARWWRLQDSRVRYFPQGPPRFVRDGIAGPPR
ncbi:MAG: hypothetical protein NZ898_05495 [Myxococcota bacterium]|nr:hypothetical protein [Myxococcota bacterium]MDW8362367.1 hypothetical protein [Myxococcales bacterium]